MRWLLLILLSVGCMRPAATVQRPTAAIDACQEHRRKGLLEQAQTCYEKLAQSSDRYLRAEGYWGVGMFQEAIDEFDVLLARVLA